MEDILTLSDKVLIENLVTVRNDEAIAMYIGKPVTAVAAYAASLNRYRIRARAHKSRKPQNTLPKKEVQRMLREMDRIRAPRKPTVKSKLEQKERERKRLVNEAEKRRVERRKVIESKKYKVRAPNLTGMVQYRLNHKTVVYAKPGEDIDLLRKKYNIKID